MLAYHYTFACMHAYKDEYTLHISLHTSFITIAIHTYKHMYVHNSKAPSCFDFFLALNFNDASGLQYTYDQ